MIAALLALAFQCPDGSPPPCSRGARAPAPLHGSIAVLPFTNRMPDQADAYLAEELPEQISGRLSRIASLRVTSATAVAAQWRRTPDPLMSARALHVEWLVTGSLRRAQSQISASIELVRVATGEQAWSSVFRSNGDIGAIETQVAESVAVAVGGRLAPEQVAVLQRTATRNPDAYRLYLNARSLTARRTTSDIQAAVTALTTALRLDPGFALGWARMAIARSLQTQYGNTEGMGVDSLLVLSRAAVDRALALDSNLAEAWLALGQWNVVAPRPDLGEAWRAFSRAVRLDSLSADIEHATGYFYGIEVLGLPDQAEPHLRRALSLNPDLRNSWRALAGLYDVRGQLPQAIAFYDTALTRGAWALGYIERGWARYEMGDKAGALADQAAADSIGFRATATSALVPLDARLALYAAERGDSAPVRARVASASTSPFDLVSKAVVAMYTGRRELALATLEQLRATRDPTEPWCAPARPCSASLRTWRTAQARVFTALRSDPRFQRLVNDTRPDVPWLR